MNTLPTPEARAEALASVRQKVPGGPWFLELHAPGAPPVALGPYENPALVENDARQVRRFLAAVLPAAVT